MRPPVVILGMHRSGTSMVARLLEELGLFVGWHKQGDHEALFFVHLNDWLFNSSGGNWDHPDSLEMLLEQADVRELVVDYLRASLTGPRVLSYLGPGRYLRHRTPFQLTEAWGWKDPRMTYTLPIWQDLFPEVRVIHVCRHGVDVASSLRVRHRWILEGRRERFGKLRPLYGLRAKQSGFTTSVRAASLENGFSLWEKYMDEARLRMREAGEHALEIHYEDLLARPVEVLGRMAEFAGLEAAPGRIEGLVADLRPDRAFAHQRDPELRGFADAVSDRLACHGYES